MRTWQQNDLMTVADQQAMSGRELTCLTAFSVQGF